jgi:hypothetical protein
MPISKKQFVKEILEMLEEHTKDLPKEEKGEVQAMMLMYTFGGGFHQPMNPELMQTLPEDEP